MTQEHLIEAWACDRAQEIMLREGFELIRSARDRNYEEIRANGLLLAKVIAASLVEASSGQHEGKPVSAAK
ncbi:MAG: hypothetical protein QHC90_07655 [Shinella sp.]|nr:hypothetical protein [Shinella sp.]